MIFILTDRDFTKGTYVLSVNVYTTPIGVLLATVWTSSKHWESERGPVITFSAGFADSVMRFRSGAPTTTLTRTVIVAETSPGGTMRQHCSENSSWKREAIEDYAVEDNEKLLRDRTLEIKPSKI